MRLKIAKLDPETLKAGGVYVLQGRRSTGKSTLLKQLLYWMREKHDLIIAMTPTESTREMLCTMMPPSCVYDEFKVPVLETIMETQKELIAKGKNRRVCLVLDDLSFDAKAFREKAVGAAFRNSRHYNCSLVVTAQAVYDLPPSLRQQVDVLFALRDPIMQSRKKLWMAYFGMMGFQDFVAAFEACTAEFGAICLDQTVPTSDVTSCVFHTRASAKLPAFRACRDVYFKLAQTAHIKPLPKSNVEFITIPPQRMMTIDEKGPPKPDPRRTMAVVR